MWDAKTVVELEVGDLFFFPDHFLLHSNEAVEGVRHSMVAFSHQNVFDYFSPRQKEKAKEQKRLSKIEKRYYQKREKLREKRDRRSE